jgi:hypothetical protein
MKLSNRTKTKTDSFSRAFKLPDLVLFRQKIANSFDVASISCTEACLVYVPVPVHSACSCAFESDRVTMSSSASALDDVFEFLKLATELEGKNRIEAATKVRFSLVDDEMRC